MDIKLIIQAHNKEGQLIYEHRGNNIWVNRGRTYLRDLICYGSVENRRIRYMGFGIGGDRQDNIVTANNEPLLSSYPGTNNQNDITRSVSRLERPVRLGGLAQPPPYDPADIWLADLNPPVSPFPGAMTWAAFFYENEFSYTDGIGTYLSVPLSEIALFLSDANIRAHDNQIVAYDTFKSFPKTNVCTIAVSWTVSFR